jgi:hypothetical protein
MRCSFRNVKLLEAAQEELLDSVEVLVKKPTS